VSAVTDSSGNYSMKLAPGSYEVNMTVSDEYETPTPQMASIVAGQTVILNFVLRRKKGTVQGSVKDEDGVALVGLTVTATKLP